MFNIICRSSSVVLVLLLSLRLVAQPLFDSHLHYSAQDAQQFNAQAILHLLDNNTITYASVTGTPSTHLSQLYQLAPERIVLLLGVYRGTADKATWMNDKTLIPYLEKELAHGYWRGIGELHIFAVDRHNKIFKEVITLASAWKLPLLLHADPAVIDTLYEIAPKQRVIWAHAGTFPYPDLVSDYLSRYPNLIIDVSMRDQRIAPDGILNDDWYELFVTHPDRFLIGVDTFSTSRWQSYSSATGVLRHWLAQLPEDIAQKLAYTNAAKFYKKPLVPNGGK